MEALIKKINFLKFIQLLMRNWKQALVKKYFVKNLKQLSWIEVGCSLGPSGTVRGSSRNLKMYAFIWNQPDHNFVISGDQINFRCCVLFFEQFFTFYFLHFLFYFCQNQSHCMSGNGKNLIFLHFESFAFFGGSLK